MLIFHCKEKSYIEMKGLPIQAKLRLILHESTQCLLDNTHSTLEFSDLAILTFLKFYVE